MVCLSNQKAYCYKAVINVLLLDSSQGDRIYIFGFSRGAFIARFLARFISQVGLLSRGNEQLVPFAYSNFLGL